VAAPVINRSGQVVAALCIVGLSARLPEKRLEELGATVKDVSSDISRALGALNYPSWNGLGRLS
jgi:DNA-binding IclR family transcriptional regulator